MLILSREVGEEIILLDTKGREIRVLVSKIIISRNNPVAKIGIEAPKDITILRGELINSNNEGEPDGQERSSGDAGSGSQDPI